MPTTKTVRYEYVVSFVVATRHAFSEPVVLRAGQWAWFASWPYQLTTVLLGWWGLPWGPMCSLAALWNNLNGGHRLDTEPATESIEPLETSG